MAYLPPFPAGIAAPAATTEREKFDAAIARADRPGAAIIAEATRHVHSVDCFVEGTQVCGMDQRMRIEP